MSNLKNLYPIFFKKKNHQNEVLISKLNAYIKITGMKRHALLLMSTKEIPFILTAINQQKENVYDKACFIIDIM